MSAERLLAYGPLGLFIVAFLESTVFPIPPDVLLLPLAMMSPRLSWWYAFLTSTASVLGGLLGYAIGRKAGRPLLKRFFKEETIRQVELLFVKYGGWAVGIAAFTPLPFKIFTFGAGIFRVPLLTFAASSIAGRSGRFFFLSALVYFLGDEAQAYLGRNFEIATLAVTLGLLAVTWLLPMLAPPGKRPLDASGATGGPGHRWREACYGALSRVRGLGTRTLAWGMASVAFAFFSLAFFEDMVGPERVALNAALGPVFAWVRPGRPSPAWRAISSVWTMGVLATSGLAFYLRPVKDSLWKRGASGGHVLRCRATRVLVGLVAATLAVEVLTRKGCPGVFSPGKPVVPYLVAIGIYLLGYRHSSRLRRAIGVIPSAAAATAMVMRFVADGQLDPACAVLSLLGSAFMFCLTMSALSVLSSQPVVPSAP